MKAMNKILALSLSVVPAIILITFSQTACSARAKSHIIQYIPPSYYNCTETTVDTLCNAYFNRYLNVAGAEMSFNGQVFVFKNIMIADVSLKNATEDYIWVQSMIKCIFLERGSAGKLKAGQKYDVVGVNGGICQDYFGTLVFNGCVFLLAGSVQLPVDGKSALTFPSY